MFNRIVIVSLFLCLSAFSAAGQTTKGYAARFNENAAYRILRQIGSSQATYSSSIGAGNYADSLQRLVKVGLLDASLAGGEKNGYRFVVNATDATPTTAPRFKVTATPSQYPKSGRKSFYTDEYGLIHAADIGGAIATVNQPEFLVCGTTESLVLPSIRSIGSSQATYASSTGAGNYATLSQLRADNLIGSILSSGQICGYLVTISVTLATLTTAPSYVINAVPQNYPISGIRSYYANESGLVTAADKHGFPATNTDPPINY